MAGPRHIVAQNFVGELAEKDNPRVADFARPAPRVFDGEADMLRREMVGDADGFVQVIHHRDDSAPVRRRPRHRLAAQAREAPFHFVRDALGERLRKADQDGRCQRVVFGLGEKIGGAQRGVGGVVRDDERLGRTVKPIHSDVSVNQLFGERDEYVAGPADHVRFGDGFRSVSHRRHRLRAAYAEYSVHAGDFRRRQRCRVGQAAAVLRGRGAHENLGYASDPRGDCGHQRGGRQRRGAAGDVNPHALAGLDHRAVSGGEVHPVARHGGFVIVADSVRGERQGVRDARIERGERGFHRVRRDFERGGRASLYRQRDAADCGVSARAHLADDAGDRLKRRQRLAEYAVGLLGRRPVQSPAPRQLALGGVRAYDHPHARYSPSAAIMVSTHSARNSSTLDLGTSA